MNVGGCILMLVYCVLKRMKVIVSDFLSVVFSFVIYC